MQTRDAVAESGGAPSAGAAAPLGAELDDEELLLQRALEMSRLDFQSTGTSSTAPAAPAVGESAPAAVPPTFEDDVDEVSERSPYSKLL